MDYESLLKRYMALVVGCEGWNFLQDATVGGGEADFTQEEFNRLWEIADEL